MPERDVIINVSKEFRAKVKAKKRELTYEQFFNLLLKNTEGKIPQSKTTNPPRKEILR